MDLVNKCIENAKERINNPKNKMNAFNYITYFVKRNGLSFEDDSYIREQIYKFIDENFQKLFKLDFTINGKKI